MIGIGVELGGRGVQDDLHSSTGQCDGEGERGWRIVKRIRREGGSDGRDWAGKRRRIFQEWIEPDDTFDFEKHQGKTFREEYLTDLGSYDWTVRQDKTGDAESEVLQIHRKMSERPQQDEN